MVKGLVSRTRRRVQAACVLREPRSGMLPWHISLRRMEKMNRFGIVISLVLASMLMTDSCVVSGQQSFRERFIAHNSEMGALQPSWIVPLVTPDPRLIQYARVSVSHEYTAAHAETVNYGNGRGFGLISGNRFEFDYVQPAYIQHNTAGAMDGFGDTSMAVKYRIASGKRKLAAAGKAAAAPGKTTCAAKP